MENLQKEMGGFTVLQIGRTSQRSGRRGWQKWLTYQWKFFRLRLIVLTLVGVGLIVFFSMAYDAHRFLLKFNRDIAIEEIAKENDVPVNVIKIEKFKLRDGYADERLFLLKCRIDGRQIEYSGIIDSYGGTTAVRYLGEGKIFWQ